MQRSPTIFVLLALLVATLQGCILGRVRDQVPLDAEKVAKIVPGQTTKKEVVELLGAPTYVNDRIGLRVLGKPVQANGNVGPLIDELVQSPLDHSYTYEYTDTKSLSLYLLIVSFTNQETKRDRVVVFFDQKGLVSHMGATFDAKDVSFRLPTSD
jgi:outer membrane protein assembly factor BamE (lipoprotein component of BamABCDE complex)